MDSIVTHEERATAAKLRSLPSELELDGDSELERRAIRPLFDPEVSPLPAESLTDLPSAYVVTCGHDPLRDEGLLYVKRIRREGVAAHSKHYPHFTHGHIGLDRENIIQRDLKLRPELL